MKKGDIVVMKKGEEPYYKKGDKARLCRHLGYDDWLADFTVNDSYFGDGEWLVYESNFHEYRTHKKWIDNLLSCWRLRFYAGE
jgi:hypothetical protein